MSRSKRRRERKDETDQLVETVNRIALITGKLLLLGIKAIFDKIFKRPVLEAKLAQQENRDCMDIDTLQPKHI